MAETPTPSPANPTPAAAKPAATRSMDTNFSEHVQFGTIYEGLAQKGIDLTEEEKKRLEQITKAELKHHDNSVMSGLGLSNVFYLLFAVIGNLMKGKGAPNFDNIGDQIAASNSQSVEMSKLRQLELASTAIFRDLKAEGGNLAAAAEYVTAVNLKGGEYKPMDNSIYDQLRVDIRLPPEVTSSRLASLDPRLQTDLPSKHRTQSLTPRG